MIKIEYKKVSIKPKLEDISFEVITNVYPTKRGRRVAKRKAVFLYDLEKYFKIKKR